jgi:pre-mRNA-processing factor 39
VAAADGAAEAEVEPAPSAPRPVTDDDVKVAWMATRESVYQATRSTLAARKPFEDAIKRPYFHVKPLDAVQLANWSRYLDYSQANDDEGATLRLYERCLVACASYPGAAPYPHTMCAPTYTFTHATRPQKRTSAQDRLVICQGTR